MLNVHRIVSLGTDSAGLAMLFEVRTLYCKKCFHLRRRVEPVAAVDPIYGFMTL